jgi:cytidyltransferase-like protein
MGVIVITSGGFDPLHMGHVCLLHGCRELGGRVIVLVNSDAWLTRKKGKPFMELPERMGILSALRCVDHVWVAQDTDDTVVASLRIARELFASDHLIFAKGGDRTAENTPEKAFCMTHDIHVLYGVGGAKSNSSSDLLRAWNEATG